MVAKLLLAANELFPLLVGLTFIPRFWNTKDEDSIWVDCVEKPELSGYIFYLYLDNWVINENSC